MGGCGSKGKKTVPEGRRSTVRSENGFFNQNTVDDRDATKTTVSSSFDVRTTSASKKTTSAYKTYEFGLEGADDEAIIEDIPRKNRKDSEEDRKQLEVKFNAERGNLSYLDVEEKELRQKLNQDGAKSKKENLDEATYKSNVKRWEDVQKNQTKLMNARKKFDNSKFKKHPGASEKKNDDSLFGGDSVSTTALSLNQSTGVHKSSEAGLHDLEGEPTPWINGSGKKSSALSIQVKTQKTNDFNYGTGYGTSSTLTNTYNSGTFGTTEKKKKPEDDEEALMDEILKDLDDI